jgi:hypothetical protein
LGLGGSRRILAARSPSVTLVGRLSRGGRGTGSGWPRQNAMTGNLANCEVTQFVTRQPAPAYSTESVFFLEKSIGRMRRLWLMPPCRPSVMGFPVPLPGCFPPLALASHRILDAMWTRWGKTNVNGWRAETWLKVNCSVRPCVTNVTMPTTNDARRTAPHPRHQRRQWRRTKHSRCP